MSEQRLLNPFRDAPKSAERSIWSFFDGYKVSGENEAILRPKLESFTHVSEESKQRDQGLLRQKMGRNDLNQQRTEGPDAFAFENFLTTEAIKHRWFGGEMSPTTEYDDWISGADAYVEWLDEGQLPVRMAIDFTTTDKFRVFAKKSEKLELNSQIKYLRSRIESEDGEPKEMSASMPIVILGAEEKTFKLIAEEAKALSDEHPLRRMLAEQASAQIALQLSLFHEKVIQNSRAGRKSGSELGSKELKRYESLLAVQRCLDKERLITDEIILDPVWKKNAELSITQSVLLSQ